MNTHVVDEAPRALSVCEDETAREGGRVDPGAAPGSSERQSMATRIDIYTPKSGGAPTRRRGWGWSSWLVVLLCLAAQLWIVANVSESGRPPLLALSVVLEYGAIMWCENRAACRDL